MNSTTIYIGVVLLGPLVLGLLSCVFCYFMDQKSEINSEIDNLKELVEKQWKEDGAFQVQRKDLFGSQHSKCRPKVR